MLAKPLAVTSRHRYYITYTFWLCVSLWVNCRVDCRATIAPSAIVARNNNNNNQRQCLWCYPHDHGHCESSPGSFDEYRLSAGWSPSLSPSQPTWAVSPPINGCYHPHILFYTCVWHCWVTWASDLSSHAAWAVSKFYFGGPSLI